MNYREYLETLVGKKCNISNTNDSWLISFDPNTHQTVVVKEVHDDFVIIESFDEKVTQRTVIPLNLLTIKAYLT